HSHSIMLALKSVHCEIGRNCRLCSLSVLPMKADCSPRKLSLKLMNSCEKLSSGVVSMSMSRLVSLSLSDKISGTIEGLAKSFPRTTIYLDVCDGVQSIQH